MPKKVLVICGATASGKTRLAVDCALKLNTEIISADSQLIYKGLNVGTAKPTEEETCGVKHHMIDIVEPTETFSVSDYSERALPILESLLSEGKTPIICGGTGFYINSLLFDFGYGNTAADENVRKKYAEYLNNNGKEALFEKLREVDPESSAVLHPNDTKRVIRALEIFEVSGKKKSEQNDELIPKYDFIAVSINYPREELYARINRRVDEMFDKGLVEEVQSLLVRGINGSCQCMQAIGYKEVVFGLENGSLRSTMSDIIKQNTRHYAKRQITFFKKMPNLVWLNPNEATADKVAEILNEIN
ncbi:MAG: tRNA (adenosine(37)-N6)-dimethylallyltransferase MiaA [Clostridia bacterium]|nr:tRNA (adenosine(37)-N6)-dimethylallyltransferase MiaA [Clostridia bacterium]